MLNYFLFLIYFVLSFLYALQDCQDWSNSFIFLIPFNSFILQK